MSPEVICRMNHSFEADFFALGVIIYELIFGTVLLNLLRDHTSGIQESKFGKRFWLIKLRSMRRTFPEVGVLLA